MTMLKIPPGEVLNVSSPRKLRLTGLPKASFPLTLSLIVIPPLFITSKIPRRFYLGLLDYDYLLLISGINYYNLICKNQILIQGNVKL